jgi:uncharacterized membrane protein
VAKPDVQDTNRTEAFSDGVFAVAITLLALDLKPDLGAGSRSSAALVRALAGAWPTYLSFALSFSAVLIMWINHHAIFKFAERVTNRLLFSNGLLLCLTTLVPFATGFLALHLLGVGSRVAAGLYAGLFLLINLSYNLLWRSITCQSPSRMADPIRRRIGRSYLIGFAGYTTALVLAIWSPFATIVICVILWGVWTTNVQPVHGGGTS